MSSTLLYQRTELFSSETSSQVYGSTPRVTTSLSPQRLFNAPIYASANVEAAFLPDRTISDGVVTSDRGYTRLDVSPTVRVPMSRLTFLSLNTSAAYRATHYSRSAALTTEATIDEPYLRQFMTLRSDIVGPVFTRIWDLQGGFAERIKHVIEPAFTVDFTSHIENHNRTPVVSDYSDFVVSGATKFTYGLTNRLFARGRTVDNVRGIDARNHDRRTAADLLFRSAVRWIRQLVSEHLRHPPSGGPVTGRAHDPGLTRGADRYQHATRIRRLRRDAACGPSRSAGP